jgi:hypothetical protein
MKMIATFAVATALLGLAACSTEDTVPATEEVAPATEEVAPATDAAPATEEAASGDKPADSVVEVLN